MTRNPASGRVSATVLIVVAAFATAIGLWLGARLLSSPSHDALPALKTAVMYPQPRGVPEFQLTQANGKPLTRADWEGRWTVAFFGFTHCPDVCPITLNVFKQVWATLDAQGKTARLSFDFISVDPERDTPELLAQYVAFYNPDFIAATGSDEQLTALTRPLGLIYARTPDEHGSYSVDHTASAVIIDPAGRLIGLFRPPFEAGPIAADLATLVESR
ncbi:MAG: SCO family protein [Dokdonella sp.]